MVRRPACGLPICRQPVPKSPILRRSHPTGAGFTLLYLDDDLRMHRTFDGQYFVQQRTSSGPK